MTSRIGHFYSIYEVAQVVNMFVSGIVWKKDNLMINHEIVLVKELRINSRIMDVTK